MVSDREPSSDHHRRPLRILRWADVAGGNPDLTADRRSALHANPGRWHQWTRVTPSSAAGPGRAGRDWRVGQTEAVSDTPGAQDPALPADERPFDPTPRHTEDLPDTPVRDRNIPAEAWIEAPPELLALGDGIGSPPIAYKRRLGPWLLWRAGPARGADARYLAINARDLSRSFSFHLRPDGTGDGIGPSGRRHQRFRTWKEDLRDHG